MRCASMRLIAKRSEDEAREIVAHEARLKHGAGDIPRLFHFDTAGGEYGPFWRRWRSTAPTIQGQKVNGIVNAVDPQKKECVSSPLHLAGGYALMPPPLR